MSAIRSESIKGQKHISVMGGVETQEEQREFLALLRERGGASEIHVTFFDAKTLPAGIIESLRFHFAQFPETPLKVFTLHRYLASYLSRLGIPNKFVFEKTLVPVVPRRIKAVGIGGSAESLDKIFAIVKSLALANISVFIVQHFPRDARNILDALLQDKTPYRTCLPTDGMTVETDVMYIAPSDAHMIVERGVIRLTKDAPVNYSRPSIDVLFESLSREYKNGLLAILLCGYGSDGSHSLKTLRTHGARIIIEDPLDCSARDMPNNGLLTGAYDYKFPIQELCSYVSRTIRKEEIELPDAEIREFLTDLHKQYGYDYRNYSIESIKRRLQKAMTDRGFYLFSQFAAQVLHDAELFEELFLEFSINVTHFFRNPEVFSVIREEIFPYLDTYPHIKIWCAGCSTGEEPYSLAILLQEAGLLRKTQIYATDLNPYVLVEAKNGLFGGGNLDSDQENYRKSGGKGRIHDYFDVEGNILKINEALKTKILFFQHSLVNSGILNEFQIILCRNVLIYFNATLQIETLRLFQDSLDRNGFLVLGESETIPPNDGRLAFEPLDHRRKIYRKRKFL